MTGVEMENAAAESSCDDVDPLPSSPLPSSSRRKQVSKPIYSSSPGTERMMTAGEVVGDLGWNGHEIAGRWTIYFGALPKGEGVGWQSGSWVGQKPPPSDPSFLAPMIPTLPSLAGGSRPGLALPRPSPAFWDYHCAREHWFVHRG